MLVICLSLLMVISHSGYSQVNIQLKVDSLFNHLSVQTPGAVVTIVHNDTVLYTQGYGMANLAYSVPMTENTLIDIGSCAKTFTAFATLLLVEARKISLNDDIRKYLPEFPDYGHKITIRHLGTHTSGIREWIQLIHLSGYGYVGDPKTKEHLLNLIYNQEGLNFVPGEKFNYSNSNYLLLAEIIERVSGKSFAQFTDENIFQPLGMSNTFFYDDFYKIRENAAARYYYEGNELKEVPQHHASPGDGSLYTTSVDMEKWLIYFNKIKNESMNIYSALTEQMKLNDETIISSAFGQYFDPYKGILQFQHSGDAGGINSYVTHFPDENLSIFISCNDYDCSAQFLALQIADIFLDFESVHYTQIESQHSKSFIHQLPNLKEFEGYYWSEDVNLSREIEYRSDSLFYVRSNGNESPLIPVSENEFKFDGSTVEAKIWFEVNSTGHKIFYYQYQNDLPNTFVEYEPRTYKPNELYQFEGIYYSRELRSIYEIKVKSGELVAVHFRKGHTILTPVMDDFFSGSSISFGQVQFYRNEHKIVSSFEVSSRNAKGIVFRKISE